LQLDDSLIIYIETDARRNRDVTPTTIAVS